MAMGYCALCERLVFIVAKGFKYAGGKERNWHPVDHLDERGAPCNGTKKAL